MEKFKRSAFLIVMGTAILLFMSGCGMKKRATVMSGESLSQTTEVSTTEKVVPQSAGIPLREESLSQEDIVLGNSGPGTTETASVPAGSDFQPATETVGVPPGLDFQPGLPPQPTLRGFPKVGDSDEGKMVASVAPEQPSHPIVLPEGPRGLASGIRSELPPQPRELPEKTMASGETGIPSEPPLEPIVMKSITEPPFDPGPTGYEGVDFSRGLSSLDFLPELPPQPNLAEVKAEALGAPSEESESILPESRINILPTTPLPHKQKVVEKKVESEQEEIREDLAGVPGQELSREGTRMAEAKKSTAKDKFQGSGHAMALLDEFFEFDSWRLTNEAKRALEANAMWIKENPNKNIIIEGHCDERGTESYNVELGMRRANVTRNFLLDLGVDSSRIKTVSYGEFRPFCADQNEDCYQKNRRAHFVVVS